MSAILSWPQWVDIEHQCAITKHAYCNSIITTYYTLMFIWPRPWVSDWLNDTYVCSQNCWPMCMSGRACTSAWHYLALGGHSTQTEENSAQKRFAMIHVLYYIFSSPKWGAPRRKSLDWIHIANPQRFSYILWRSRNYFVIEMERNECGYDCVCDLSQIVLFPS